MARVIFVNRFYWPDETATGQLLTDLAESLARRGHEVQIIASRPRGFSQSSPFVHHGVRVSHVGSARSGGGGVASKTLDFGTFLFGATWSLFRHVRRDTTVVAMTDPPLMAIAAWVVARLRGARLVHWVQDIYPELAIELAGQRWLRVAQPLRDRAWRAATHCVTLGEDMAGQLRRSGVPADRIEIVPNWAPVAIVPPEAREIDWLRAAWGLAEKFVVGYSGNLGRVHDLAPVIDVATALRGRVDIAFVFVGGGAQRMALEKTARERKLANVRFLPPQSRAILAAALAVPDVHFVTLRPGCAPLVFPSKLYGIAAVGRPVIFVGPPNCDVARTVAGAGFGRVFARDQTAEMADAIAQLAGDPGERALLGNAAARFAEKYGWEHAARAWHALLEPAEGSPHAARARIQTTSP